MSDQQPTTPETTGEATDQQSAIDISGLPPEVQERIAELEGKVQKYKSLMRQEEAKKKELWNELQGLREANMSEAEKALAEAERRGREAAKAEYEAQIRQSKLQAAAAKAGVPEEVVGLLDPGKVFGEDGEPNLELLSSLSGAKRKFEKTASDLNIGARSNTNAGQLTLADLDRMTPAEVMQARKEGRLDALMRGQIQ